MDSIMMVLYWLISTGFYLYVLLLMLRFLFPLFRVNSNNQFVQSVNTFTQSVVMSFASMVRLKSEYWRFLSNLVYEKQ